MVEPEEVVQALAATLLALLVTEVIGIRENPEEPDQAVQLPHPVLEGGPAQGPLVAAVQGKDRLGSAAAAVLDAVSLVQDDAPPGNLHRANTNLSFPSRKGDSSLITSFEAFVLSFQMRLE